MYDSDCPVLYALNIIGQKWKLPILWHLMLKDVTRYNELKRSLNGITNIMLTKCLRELEEHSLVKRVEYDTKPPKVEYSLTERGKALLPTLNGLYKWGEEQYKLDHEEID
ncbi:winged helix-turn-helix transcriptional regulator [Intestinibacter bartlettii]|uniref:Helix-turn-helix transcriptional regulator n=1 Tax=Intestinibacter bartlettii TaxID=261299 RepID=A0ABS6DXM1_9FIRM|nr:helix-turn-helix transcriptional regulator [Intestinibacter bartlettii]